MLIRTVINIYLIYLKSNYIYIYIICMCNIKYDQIDGTSLSYQIVKHIKRHTTELYEKY